MKNVIAQIRASSQALSNLADALERKEVEGKNVEKEVESEKKEVESENRNEEKEVENTSEEKKTYTFEEVRTLLTLKSREGKTDAVRALLQAHGATTLSALKEEDYPTVMKEAEGL